MWIMTLVHGGAHDCYYVAPTNTQHNILYIKYTLLLSYWDCIGMALDQCQV